MSALHHGRVDPRGSRPQAPLPISLLDQPARQIGPHLGAPAGQLADRRLGRDPRRERNQAEAEQVQRVRHLAHQRLVAEARALLDHHQAHVGLHRDRRPPPLPRRPLPPLGDRSQQPGVPEQLVDPRQVLRQLPRFDRQQLVPERLRLPRQQRQHTHLPTLETEQPLFCREFPGQTLPQVLLAMQKVEALVGERAGAGVRDDFTAKRALGLPAGPGVVGSR
jgi:hypothetical protein